MGPLHGITFIELGGIGPVPFCGMLFADMGADVIRVDRPDMAAVDRHSRPLVRGSRSVVVDLKHPQGPGTIVRLAAGADALIEGFRPGVAERLGVGPEPCMEANPALVYGRMTGWGQEGPLARVAGHDINYIALAGVLGLIGPPDSPPAVPLNLIADFGGGGMLLAFGVLSALLEARTSGAGQVVDAAMVDGAALLSAMAHGMHAEGLWPEARGKNLLDGGAPFYRVYETADGSYVSIGALEPVFFGELLDRLGLEAELVGSQYDTSRWPELHSRFEEVFAARTAAEWRNLLEGTDVCFAEVLSPWEAHRHPHVAHRRTFVEVDGTPMPAPAPRFSRTVPNQPEPPPPPGRDTDEILGDFGWSRDEITDLRASGAVA